MARERKKDPDQKMIEVDMGKGSSMRITTGKPLEPTSAVNLAKNEPGQLADAKEKFIAQMRSLHRSVIQKHIVDPLVGSMGSIEREDVVVALEKTVNKASDVSSMVAYKTAVELHKGAKALSKDVLRPTGQWTYDHAVEPFFARPRINRRAVRVVDGIMILNPILALTGDFLATNSAQISQALNSNPNLMAKVGEFAVDVYTKLFPQLSSTDYALVGTGLLFLGLGARTKLLRIRTNHAAEYRAWEKERKEKERLKRAQKDLDKERKKLEKAKKGKSSSFWHL